MRRRCSCPSDKTAFTLDILSVSLPEAVREADLGDPHSVLGDTLFALVSIPFLSRTRPE